MKLNKKINYLLLIIVMFSITIMNCLAAFPDSFTTPSDSPKEIDTNGYTTGKGSSASIWLLHTTDNLDIWCLNIGKKYVHPETFTRTSTIIGTGAACGLLDAYKADNTLNDFSYINQSQYIAIQKKIWDYEGSSATCTKSLVKSDTFPVGKIYMSAPSNLMTLNSDSSLYVSSKITLNLSNLSAYSVKLTNAPTGTYVSETIGGSSVSSSSSNTLYVNVPVASVTSAMNFSLSATASFNKSQNTYMTPSMAIYETSDHANAGITYQQLSMITASFEKDYTTDTTSASLNFISKVGSLSILKKSSKDQARVEGATFELYNSENELAKHIDGSLVGTLTTDSDGKFTVKNLPYGEYILIETSAPKGYVIATEGILVQVNEKTDPVIVTNNPVSTKISKKDITNEKELVGAHIIITDLNGKYVAEYDSTEEAYEIYLGPGQYFLKETVSPSGYSKIENTFKFEVKDDSTVKLLSEDSDYFKSEENEITLYNAPTTVDVPNTGISTMLYTIIGSILFVAGGILIYYVKTKKEKISL